MIKLIIKDVGYFVNIPNLLSFRTPVTINISKNNIDLVMTELKKLGIENFIFEKNNIKNFKKESIVKNKMEQKNNILKNIENRIIKIEKMLEKNSNKSSKTIIKEIIQTKENLKNEDDIYKVDEFIPNINTSKLEFNESSLSIKKEINNKENINETSKLLSNMLKKKRRRI